MSPKLGNCKCRCIEHENEIECMNKGYQNCFAISQKEYEIYQKKTPVFQKAVRDKIWIWNGENYEMVIKTHKEKKVLNQKNLEKQVQVKERRIG
jgi:hypothetical protein